MKRSDFVTKILATPCEKCPIEGYCRIAKTFSCNMTARTYFNIIAKGKEELPWHTLETAWNFGLTRRA